MSAYSVDYDHEMGAIYGFDTPLAGSVLSLSPPAGAGKCPNFISVHANTIKQLPNITPPAPNNNHKQQEITVNKWWSNSSLNTVNLGSSIKIFDEKARRMSRSSNIKTKSSNEPADAVYNELSQKKEKKTSPFRKFLKSIVNFFDLKLLLDPVFLNIMVGMSLAVFAELNFSILTPFIMADFGLDTAQSASFLSVLSIADLVFRFLAPFIGDYLKKPPRKMYMLTLFLLIISRFSKYGSVVLVYVCCSKASVVLKHFITP